jgi:hypothetical protein
VISDPMMPIFHNIEVMLLCYISFVYYVVYRIKEYQYCIWRAASVNWGFDGRTCSLTCYFCTNVFSTIKSSTDAGNSSNTILLFINSTYHTIYKRYITQQHELYNMKYKHHKNSEITFKTELVNLCFPIFWRRVCKWLNMYLFYLITW